DPAGLRYSLNWFWDHFQLPLFIVENGFGAVDQRQADGTVNDHYRIDYFASHIRELKKVLSVDLGALTRMLDRLVCKGWVERLPNPNDKRGVLVKLTTSGAAICEQCHQLVGQDLHQELTKNLTADEVATLEHLLKKVLP
ncbi:family 1 glycosylhydrolase, partial [Escherichia sp. TWPC-MK]